MFRTTKSRPRWASGILVALSLGLTSCVVPAEPVPEPTETSSPSVTPSVTPSATASAPAGEPTAAPTTGPSGSAEPTATPTTSATATPSTAPTAGPTTAPPADLVTYTGHAADAEFSFQLPATWSVSDTSNDVIGSVVVHGPDGEPIGTLTVLMAWGAVCGPACEPQPVVHLGDVPGEQPLSHSGEFVVRSLAMDLTGAPEVRNFFGWPDNVRLVTSLTDLPAPVPATMPPHPMHGVGLIRAGVPASNGAIYRTVIFTSERDFSTLQEARDYAESQEHQQVQEMIASFRG